MLHPSDYARPQSEDISRIAALRRRKTVMVKQATDSKNPVHAVTRWSWTSEKRPSILLMVLRR